MKKKKVFLIAAIILLCFATAGCASQSQSPHTNESGKSTEQTPGQSDAGKSNDNGMLEGTYVFKSVAHDISYTFSWNKVTKIAVEHLLDETYEETGNFEFKDGILTIEYIVGGNAGLTYNYPCELEGNVLKILDIEFNKEEN